MFVKTILISFLISTYIHKNFSIYFTKYHFKLPIIGHGVFKILIISRNRFHNFNVRIEKKKKNREKIRILFLERVLSKTPKAFEKKKGEKKKK